LTKQLGDVQVDRDELAIVREADGLVPVRSVGERLGRLV